VVNERTLGEQDTVRPDGEESTVRFTVLLEPRRLVSVIVALPVDPASILKVVASMAMLKSETRIRGRKSPPWSIVPPEVYGSSVSPNPSPSVSVPL
jgi:hypothetical protein